MIETMPLQYHIGSLIQRARLVRNQTQEDLAQEAGISVRALRKLENGDTVNSSLFFDVIRVLGYEQDILTILAQPKPRTIEQHQDLANGKRIRRRAR